MDREFNIFDMEAPLELPKSVVAERQVTILLRKYCFEF
jgi:hypothetical protein